MFRKNVIGAVIALMAMIGFLAIMGLLALGFVDVPIESRDFFNISLGALIGFAGAGVNFYLGSSLGSSEKTDLMSKMNK